jgi:hypothetical protein
MSTTVTPQAPQGPVPAIGVPNSQDYPRLVFTAPYFETVPLAELIEPAVIEAVEGALPSLVPPYVQDAANAAVQQNAVLLVGSTMTGPLFLSPTIPTQPSQAASMAYVDAMIATAGIPEVPPVPTGQTWARQTGQWVPISEEEGTFLPLAGGTMLGAINMSGNAITNLPALPVMPNGAAPAQWVLNQIAAASLYQGTWVPDTNTPDLTQPATHQNGFTWIVTTSTVGGVVVSQPIPGLQGQTVFNGDTVIYSAIAGQFQIIHGGGLSLEEAQALFLPLAGGQMSGALLLNANASQPTQATTLQQVQSLVATAGIPEAPADGQAYGRVGISTGSWVPVLPLAGGILTGSLSLAGNASTALQAVPLQQLNSSLANYVPIAGGVTMTGPLTMGSAATLTLAANAAANLQAVPLQQMTSVLAGYVTQTQLTAAVAPYIPQNYVDNSGFTINQRAYASGTALTAGVYGFDRWKGGPAAGGTATFVASPASTIVTITAGSLQQVIEGGSLITATYTLSWTGTATGRIATTSGGGTYAASPVQFTATANTNTFIEFTGGTLGQLQLQLGTVATPWQPLPTAIELSRCQRFYQTAPTYLGGWATTTTALLTTTVPFITSLRAVPTVGLPGWSFSNLAALTVGSAELRGWVPSLTVTAAGGYGASGTWTASADL